MEGKCCIIQYTLVLSIVCIINKKVAFTASARARFRQQPTSRPKLLALLPASSCYCSLRSVVLSNYRAYLKKRVKRQVEGQWDVCLAKREFPTRKAANTLNKLDMYRNRRWTSTCLLGLARHGFIPLYFVDRPTEISI